MPLQRTLPLLVLVLICMGCHDLPTDTKKTSEILPLEVGNKWIMSTSYYDTAGSVFKTSYETTVVFQDTTLQSYRWFKVVRSIADSAFTSTAALFFRNSDAGLMVWNYPGELLLYKYPANPGDIYGTRSVISTSTTVATPLGTFSCYVYEDTVRSTQHPDGAILVRSYIAPDVGFVKTQTYIGRGIPVVWSTYAVSQLISFQLY